MDKPLKILIVDDDQRMTCTLADIFSLMGFIAVQSASGEEAIELSKITNFDCVLSDIKMPGISGITLHQTLQVRNPELPVVLMTAYTDDDLIQQGLRSGVVAVLEKPINIGLLLKFFASLRENRTVAIIDNDLIFRTTFGEILQMRGYQVKRLPKKIPNEDIAEMDDQIVLLDIKTEYADGNALLNDVFNPGTNLPMLCVTGYHDEVQNAIQNASEVYTHVSMNKLLQIDEILRTLAQIQLDRLRREISNLRCYW